MHADRTNRTMLILFALVLIAAGGVGVAAGYGALGSVTKHGALTANRVSAFIGRNGNWLWPVAALVAIAVLLLALRWLLTLLFTTDRAHDIALVKSGGAGRSTLSGSALTRAVSDEISSYPGVDSARARLLGDPEEPELAVSATLEESADLAGLRRRIEDEALAHARQATGRAAMATRLDLNVTTRRSTRTA